MTKTKILKYLITNNSIVFTIREISQNLKISYKIVYDIIKRLESEKLLSISKVGNSSQVKFNFNFNEKVLKAENSRKEDLLKNKNFKILVNRLNEVRSPFFIALIFGSYAKNTQNKSSDIDLCIISENSILHKKIIDNLSILPLDLHISEFTVDEFQEMLKTNNFNVGHEIVKNNVILHGIESYYKVIKNE